MRLVTASEQDNASNYAMKGFAVGAAQWAGVGLFASALAYSFFPWYRRTQTVNKVMFDKFKSKSKANMVNLVLYCHVLCIGWWCLQVRSIHGQL